MMGNDGELPITTQFYPERSGSTQSEAELPSSTQSAAALPITTQFYSERSGSTHLYPEKNSNPNPVTLRMLNRVG